MKYLHTMVRVNDLDASIRFYVDILGLVEVRRVDYEAGRFTLVFLSAPDDVNDGTEIDSPLIELTHNWETEALHSGRNFGHLAFRVKDIYETCAKIAAAGVQINRPPRDGRMAFIKSPDNISIELLQEGEALPSMEPWASLPNEGSW